MTKNGRQGLDVMLFLSIIYLKYVRINKVRGIFIIETAKALKNHTILLKKYQAFIIYILFLSNRLFISNRLRVSQIQMTNLTHATK